MGKPETGLFTGFSQRLIVLVTIFLLEKFLFLHLPGNWMLSPVHWLGGMPVAFGLALFFFSRRKSSLLALEQLPVGYGYIWLHIAMLVVLSLLRWYLPPSRFPSGSWQFQATATMWTALLVLAVYFLICIFIPPRKQWHIARDLGFAWVYALACSAAIIVVRSLADTSWDTPSSPLGHWLHHACFNQTRWLLQFFYPLVLAVPERHLLGPPTFLVEISWLCSGIEGLVLVAILIGAWLIYARHELRMARAILLLPLALLVTWYLNIVRLTVLIAIGNAGHPKIASQGFHAQAGWITLNLIALGFLLLVQRVPWFRQPEAEAGTPTIQTAQSEVSHRNFAAVYLLPFTVILVASLITQAVSSGFEWLYPLRFLAGLLALWAFRKEYRRLDWRFGYPGIIAGLAVAGIWIGLHALLVHDDPAAAATVTGLANLSVLARVGWIAIRILAAVITAPIAEELAFRGFLARRIQGADFQEIPFAQMGVFSIFLSSIAFGAMHGKMWVAGIIAGMTFGLVAKMRNRLGEAVAAHAIANLAIAVLAVIWNDYSLW